MSSGTATVLSSVAQGSLAIISPYGRTVDSTQTTSSQTTSSQTVNITFSTRYLQAPQQSHKNTELSTLNSDSREIYRYNSKSGETSARNQEAITSLYALRVQEDTAPPQQHKATPPPPLISIPQVKSPQTENEVIHALRTFLLPLLARLSAYKGFEYGAFLRTVTAEQYENACKLQFFQQLFAQQSSDDQNRLIALMIPNIIGNKATTTVDVIRVNDLFVDFVELNVEERNKRKKQKARTILVNPLTTASIQPVQAATQDVVVKESGGCCIIM